MNQLLIKSLSTLALCALTSSIFAASATPPVLTKNYQLLKLKQVVVNDPNCRAVYKSLKKLKNNPLSFQFVANNKANTSFKLNDSSGLIQSHSYSVINQIVNGSVVERIGMGNFTLDQQLIEYVIVIAGDTSQPKFNYLYPVILSSNNSHCHFTAILKPDADTQNRFKDSISNGFINSKKDLLS